MLRQVHAGRFAEAIAIAKQHLALPATLGRVCHRPCERPCRRKTFDAPVAIGQIERCVADQDLASPASYLPDKAAPTGRRVAIVGAGPTGLSAAWHLLLRGHDCTLFDERETAGGSLFDEFPADVLPPDVVAAEVESDPPLGGRVRTRQPARRCRRPGTTVGRVRRGLMCGRPGQQPRSDPTRSGDRPARHWRQPLSPDQSPAGVCGRSSRPPHRQAGPLGRGRAVGGDLPRPIPLRRLP